VAAGGVVLDRRDAHITLSEVAPKIFPGLKVTQQQRSASRGALLRG
jgi:hypothetical protein